MSQLLRGALLLALLAVISPAQVNSLSSHSNSKAKENPRNVVLNHLAGSGLHLQATGSDAHFRAKITDYLNRGSRSTERMLGRANAYFPVFEYYLAKHQMPSSLKYLAVAESMLVPRAVSSAHAAGLWQLMPVTAREMGLRVDRVVDERLDVYRSTEAAVLMLKDLYAQFGDWHLTLAAYNCGAGRVRRAIRRAGGYTYYPKVRPYLPEESQKYVAAYLAAAYTLNYYEDYGLTPKEYVLDLDRVATLRVYRTTNFRRAACATNIPYATLRQLNPSYVRAYVPRSRRGYELRVPSDLRHEMQIYLWDGRTNLVELPENPDLEIARRMARTDGFHAVAWLLGLSPTTVDALDQPLVLSATADRLYLAYYEARRALAMN